MIALVRFPIKSPNQFGGSPQIMKARWSRPLRPKACRSSGSRRRLKMVTLRHLPHNCGAEVEVLSILDARPMDLPAGKAWFAAVRQIAPDERLRLFLLCRCDANDDIDEA